VHADQQGSHPGVTTFDASWDHLGQRLATALGTQQEE
jgi:hypothetical protein